MKKLKSIILNYQNNTLKTISDKPNFSAHILTSLWASPIVVIICCLIMINWIKMGSDDVKLIQGILLGVISLFWLGVELLQKYALDGNNWAKQILSGWFQYAFIGWIYCLWLPYEFLFRL